MTKRIVAIGLLLVVCVGIASADGTCQAACPRVTRGEEWGAECVCWIDGKPQMRRSDAERIDGPDAWLRRLEKL